MTDTPDEIAPTDRRTPDGCVPGGVAGYIVGECTVLCVACGRDHPDVHSHPDDTDLHAYDYDYIGCTEEWDAPGVSCESCHRRLDTTVIRYE
jgi:hypothetical protein